jgi:hypothetical protein
MALRGVRLLVRVAYSVVRSAARLQEDDAAEDQAQGDDSRVSGITDLQRRRAILMSHHPFCHWCEKKLIYFKMEGGGKLPSDFATIDHINSRLMYPDGRPKIGRRVLSCPECNQGRANEEMKSLGIEELRRRSGRGTYKITSASMMPSSPNEFSSPSAQSGESKAPIALARSENKVLAKSI